MTSYPTLPPPPEGGVRLAHISDLHVLDLKGVMPWRWLSKRATGGLNLLLKRGKLHSTEVLVKALEHLQELDVDHTVATGDLSNLALESEFIACRTLLANHTAGPKHVSVIPGNHDNYTSRSASTRRFDTFFKDWMTPDLPPLEGATYPYVRLVGEGLAVVGVSSSIPTPPMDATGLVGPEQRDRLARTLSQPELKDRFVVVALHHHPVRPKYTTDRHERSHGLKDNSEVLETLLSGGADLVIHGHNHQYGFTVHDRPDKGLMHICEAGSSSVRSFKEPHFGGKFNIYDLAPDNDGGLNLQRIITFLYREEDGHFSVWKDLSAPFDPRV